MERDEWVALDGLPRFRAGCVGFFVGNGEKREFWVMGGYGESRTISGVFPVDEYYRDAVVMELRNGHGSGRWRQIGDMWEDGERRRLGKIVVIENYIHGQPGIFMLDGDEFLRLLFIFLVGYVLFKIPIIVENDFSFLHGLL